MEACPECGKEVECLADCVKGTVVGKRADNMPIIDYIPVHIPMGMECLKVQNKTLREQLAKWPRVFFHSFDPATSSEGRRVMEVRGHEGDGDDSTWFEVLIDAGDPDGPIYAPADFGLYSSREDLEKGQIDG